MKGAIGRIAREEWRALARNRAGLVGCVLLTALVLTAAVVSLEQRRTIDTARARYQASADQEFESPPDRHPHRMVHYGQFVFRPLPPLAFFDFGVNGFTGSTIFLEGHRQNSANFSDARQSSLLVRFGQLTPAFVLQTLAPLLVVFLAFGAVARERERGTLKALLAQGVSGAELMAGKALGHGAIALLLASPAFVVLAAMALTGAAPASAGLLLMLGYAAYLLIWALGAVLVSAVCTRPRDALLALVGLWAFSVILIPRVLPQAAAAQAAAPTRIETEIRLHRDLARIGDSHNPDDPYFSSFKAQTLARYGVQRVEDLPVQYAGLVALEGERLTTELYERYAREAFALEDAQGRFVSIFGAVTPLIAIRQTSMALAAADNRSHRDFLEQAERHRYGVVQALNRMQAEQIPNTGAGEDPRISSANWKTIPSFQHQAPDALRLNAGPICSGLGLLAAWIGALVLALPFAGRRLGKVAR